MSSSIIFQLVRRHRTAVRALKFSTQNSSTTVEKTEQSDGSLKSKDTTKEDKLPFMKNVFLGKFDTDFLAFPEVLESQQISNLEANVMSVEKVLKKVNVSSTVSSLNNEESLKELKTLGVFGLQVPDIYGGLDLKATEYARFSEVLSLDSSLAIVLASHQAFGMKGLLSYGTAEQKKQYLNLLASGEWIAAFCLAEFVSNSDSTAVETRAKLSEDGQEWHITGSKILIGSDRIPDLMTVIAKTEVDGIAGKKEDTLSAFLVEKSFAGISSDRGKDILGGCGAHLYEVRFKSCPVPVKNLLGHVGDGFRISTNVLSANRCNAGSICAGILKDLLQVTTEHAINHKQFGKNIMDFESVQEKIANITCSIYAMESMTYLTAGVIDSYNNPDTSVETAIVKVFSSEELLRNVIDCQNILGSYQFLKNDLVSSILRDSQVRALLDGSNDVLRMLIALSGLQHAGMKLNEMVQKVRNPLMNPGYIFKKILERRNNARDAPKLQLGLESFLHPSLCAEARKLEYCVLKLQYAVELMLTKHGQSITEKEIELNKLTDIAIGIYAMTAVLARASRSYCIGLHNSDFELRIAASLCYRTYNMVRNRISDIERIENYDALYKKIAKEVIRNKTYCFEHPLSRTFD